MAFEALEQIITVCEEEEIDFAEAIIREDMKDRLVTRESTVAQMTSMWENMCAASDAYDENSRSRSGLVGGAGGQMARYVAAGNPLCGDRMGRVIAQALQMGESNACMKRIVAAPTAGACGVLPAVLIPLFREGTDSTAQSEHACAAANDIYPAANEPDAAALTTDDRSVAGSPVNDTDRASSGSKRSAEELPAVRALFVAAGIGQVIATRASIAGASGGCQAEIGSASAMAAGALTYLQGGAPDQILTAVAISLKNLLGLVCDPVSGLVEVPCVKRNVIGAVNAMSAADMALAGIRSAIPADQVIDAMKEVGDLMDVSLRETGHGGLAATRRAVEITERLETEL